MARMNADKHFNLDVYLEHIEGYAPYIEAVRKASAVMFAYDVSRGTRTPFPSAFHFIEEIFDMRKRDAASRFTRAERYASTWLLRTAFKLHEYTEEISDTFTTAMVRCPQCGDVTIETQVGKLPKLGDIHPRMVSLRFGCNCKKFRTTDYYAIEALALSEIS